VQINEFDRKSIDVGGMALEIHKQGYHCSETIIRSVGSVVLDPSDLTETMLRMVFPLHGGIADTKTSHCGCLTTGILIIGALYGRITPVEDETLTMSVARRYWKLFLDEFGTTHCQTLKKGNPGPEAPTRCGGIMVRSAQILYTLLQELQSEPLSDKKKQEWLSLSLERIQQ